MAGSSMKEPHCDISARIADIHGRADRLSPLDIHQRMDAIRLQAAALGLDALEGLMHRSAQLALLPGHRVATRCCLEHVGEALSSAATFPSKHSSVPSLGAGRDAQSIAFFSAPGMDRLYSGVTKSTASMAAIASLSALPAGG